MRVFQKSQKCDDVIYEWSLGPVLSAFGDVFDPSQPNPMLYDASRRVEKGRNSSNCVRRIGREKKIVLSWTARWSSLTIFIHKNQRNLVGPFVRKRS